MTNEHGDVVWIPCDVKRGVFPDERHVTIDSTTGHWAGVVDVRLLRDEIDAGRTAVRATVVEAGPGEFSARLPGQTSRRQYLRVPASERQRFQLV